MVKSRDKESRRQRFGMIRRRYEKEVAVVITHRELLNSEQTIKFFMSAPGTTLGLLNYFLHFCTYYQPLPNQARLGRTLGKCRTHIARAMKQLWQAEIIWKVKLPHEQPVYYLNPYSYWEGSEEDRKRFLMDIHRYRVAPNNSIDIRDWPKEEFEKDEESEYFTD